MGRGKYDGNQSGYPSKSLPHVSPSIKGPDSVLGRVLRGTFEFSSGLKKKTKQNKNPTNLRQAGWHCNSVSLVLGPKERFTVGMINELY